MFWESRGHTSGSSFRDESRGSGTGSTMNTEVVMEFALTVRERLIPERELFTMIEELHDTLNLDYLDGVIHLECNGKELIGESERDYIDQLLCYILNDADKILKGGAFVTYFPDQPLRLEMTPIGENLLVRVGENTERVSSRAFFRAFYHVCRRFFNLLQRVNPSTRQRYSEYYQILDELSSHYPWIS